MITRMESSSSSNSQPDADSRLTANGIVRKRIKQHYRGKFVFNRQSYTLYRYAYTERQAWLVMCREIARKQGVSPKMVMDYFNGEKDNYIIEVETEWTEDE